MATALLAMIWLLAACGSEGSKSGTQPVSATSSNAGAKDSTSTSPPPLTSTTSTTEPKAAGQSASGTFTVDNPEYPGTWTVKIDAAPTGCRLEHVSVTAYALRADCLSGTLTATDLPFGGAWDVLLHNVMGGSTSLHVTFGIIGRPEDILDAGLAPCETSYCLTLDGYPLEDEYVGADQTPASTGFVVRFTNGQYVPRVRTDDLSKLFAVALVDDRPLAVVALAPGVEPPPLAELGETMKAG